MARKNPSPAMKERLYEKNAYSCCVCKTTGIGLNFHHLDGDSSNTVDENIAVLCVKEHDEHHRPKEYKSSNHLELSTEKLREYKNNWESFVEECKKESPNVLAVINVYGTMENIVGMKIVFQWVNGNIVFERKYQLLDSPYEVWIDLALNEVKRLGTNIQVALINEPLGIEYCDECNYSMSQIIDESFATRLTALDWKEASLCTIYLNPNQPSLAIIIFYKDEPIYSLSIHKCNNMLTLIDNKREQTIRFKKILSKRLQVKNIIIDYLSGWNIENVLIGTGDEEDPTIIDELKIPKHWEHTNC